MGRLARLTSPGANGVEYSSRLVTPHISDAFASIPSSGPSRGRTTSIWPLSRFTRKLAATPSSPRRALVPRAAHSRWPGARLRRPVAPGGQKSVVNAGGSVTRNRMIKRSGGDFAQSAALFRTPVRSRQAWLDTRCGFEPRVTGSSAGSSPRRSYWVARPATSANPLVERVRREVGAVRPRNGSGLLIDGDLREALGRPSLARTPGRSSDRALRPRRSSPSAKRSARTP